MSFDEYRAARDLIARWSGDPRELDAAEQKLNAILERDPKYALAYVGLARVAYHRGYQSDDVIDAAALDRAAVHLDEALKLDPELFEAHLTAGAIARYRRDFPRARAAYDRADALRPGRTSVKLVRADLAQAEGDYALTEKLAKEVLEEAKDDDDRVAAYAYLIDAYGARNDAEAVDAAYREQLKLCPDHPWIQYNYAEFRRQLREE